MKKLLYISANPKEDIKMSKGLQIGEVFLDAFKEENRDVLIEKWDLYRMDVPIIDTDLLYARAKLSFMGYTKDLLTQAEREKIEAMHELAERFIAADYYVFVTPLWNLGSPSILKAFLDNLFITGKTFTNTKEGPIGLLTNKIGLHIQTRGGIYSSGPMKEREFGDCFLRTALEFLGVQLMDSIIAEGLDHFPKRIPEIMNRAKEEAALAGSMMAKGQVQHYTNK